MYTLMRKTELADNRTLKQKIKQKPLQKRQYITKPDANQINLAVVNWKGHTYLGFLLGIWMLFTLVTCFGYKNFACRNNLAIPVIRIIYIWRKLPFLYLYKLISILSTLKVFMESEYVWMWGKNRCDLFIVNRPIFIKLDTIFFLS